MRITLLLFLLPALLLGQKWTMLVYIAADNDLAQWADSDLAEMEMYGSDQEIRVAVQIDKPSIGGRRLLVGQGSSATVQELGIIDMCSWVTLSDFLIWGMSMFPADNYLVILWDHGTGWTTMPRRSFGTDWSSGNVLSIANGDFQRALATAYEFTGERIDLFAFDACLMQQIEVGFELRKYARVLLAPQSIMPLAGFRYDDLLHALHMNPSITASSLAQNMINSTVSNYAGIQPIALSAVNLSHMDEMKQYFANMSAVLMSGTPSPALYSLRNNVQTIPAIGCIPDTTDDFVDLGDFLAGLEQIYGTPDVRQVLNVYDQAIMSTGYWGDDFAGITGVTAWFPDRYLQFKQLVNYYMQLEWTQSNWLGFLNWFYDRDDIRPTSVSVRASDIGANNDLTLSWAAAYDLAPVNYLVAEASDTIPIFFDPCEDSSFWHLYGFTLSSTNFHSGTSSFFSGNASNLQNYMETRNNIVIENMGILSIYLHYNTEEQGDSLILQYGPFRDVHYGATNGWIERRALLPAGNYPVRILYCTNGAMNMGGCYIDDISLCEMTGGRVIRTAYSDTSLYLYNLLRGHHMFAVYAEDWYKNRGNVSNLLGISLTDYAAPYSVPNPFQTSCSIVLDYPDTLSPAVEIYSLSGIRVRRFLPDQIIGQRVFWNGKDDEQHDVAAGIYFVLIKDTGFKRIGKIARQR
jgi:hypothetical protein